MTKAITPESLLEEGYCLKDQLSLDDLVPFLQKALKIKNAYSYGYHSFTAITFGVLIYVIFSRYSSDGFIDIGYGVSKASYGMLLALLLIPVHEWIHGMAYKLAGAKTVKYEANWKKLYFVATAHHFVTPYKWFKVVALAPFTVISVLSALSAIFLPEDFTIPALALLFVHTIFCSGDFGLLTYMKSIKASAPVTYDDLDSRITYFYIKK